MTPHRITMFTTPISIYRDTSITVIRIYIKILVIEMLTSCLWVEVNCAEPDSLLDTCIAIYDEYHDDIAY